MLSVVVPNVCWVVEVDGEKGRATLRTEFICNNSNLGSEQNAKLSLVALKEEKNVLQKLKERFLKFFKRLNNFNSVKSLISSFN